MFREKPLISLLHTTARLEPGPDGKPGWLRAFETWRDRADNPARIEYVLCVDHDPESSLVTAAHNEFGWTKGYGSKTFVENKGRRCAVDGWNAAAAASSGKLLITVSDDVFPPAPAPAIPAQYVDGELVAESVPAIHGWDTELLNAVGDLDRQAAVDIDAGSGDLMTFSILTRAYYDRYGYIFYPEYLGMFGDNDYTSQAHHDGVVVRARHLKFTHEHPAYSTAAMDSTYQHQHRAEAWAVGKRVYKKRWPDAYREVMAMCLPGESFSYHWVANIMPLVINLSHLRFLVAPHFGFSSNVHVTRGVFADGLTTKLGAHIPPDVVLWIDDDNTPTIEQVLMLHRDLVTHPEVDIVCGWCWAGNRGKDPADPRVSCGGFDENDLAVHMGVRELMAARPLKGSRDLVPVAFTGFPTVMMRYEALLKAGDTPFAPRLNAKHPWGFNSEDTSFCLNARDRAGLVIACDRRVKVTHWKFGMDEPAGVSLNAANLAQGENAA